MRPNNFKNVKRCRECAHFRKEKYGQISRCSKSGERIDGRWKCKINPSAWEEGDKAC